MIVHKICVHEDVYWQNIRQAVLFSHNSRRHVERGKLNLWRVKRRCHVPRRSTVLVVNKRQLLEVQVSRIPVARYFFFFFIYLNIDF